MNRNILVIEDDHDVRVSLRLALEMKGFTVYSAPSGLEGLDLLKLIVKPQLILLDLLMPLMDGEEFLAKIKKLPELCDIPVLIITGHTKAKIKDHEIIYKPFDLDTLHSKIHSLISSQKE